MKDLFEKQDKEFEKWADTDVVDGGGNNPYENLYPDDVLEYISKIRKETLQAVREESEQTIKDFELFWGLAPVGTPKGDKLKEIQDWLRRHLLKSLDI